MDALTKKWKNEARSFRHFRQGMKDEHLHEPHSLRLGCGLCQSLVLRSVGWKELWRSLAAPWKRDSPWPWPRPGLALPREQGKLHGPDPAELLSCTS